jgi:hypothetical protein
MISRVRHSRRTHLLYFMSSMRPGVLRRFCRGAGKLRQCREREEQPLATRILINSITRPQSVPTSALDRDAAPDTRTVALRKTWRAQRVRGPRLSSHHRP